MLDEPPDPEQDNENVLLPGIDIVTDSEPDVCFDPDHAPEAVHDEEFWDDQLIVTGVPTRAEEELDEIETDEDGLEVLPPPPPPPQDIKIKEINEI